jgi:hypothetical protein
VSGGTVTGAGAVASELESDTAVRTSAGGWTAEIHPRWNVGPNPNGGYTLAMVARAMLGACERPDPLSVTVHYVAPPAAGPVQVTTETIRAGRRYATVAARMAQGEREILRALGAFGDLAAMSGPTRVADSAPQIPPPDECVRMLEMSERSGFPAPEVMRRYDLLLDPACQWVRARTGPAGTAPPVGDAGAAWVGDAGSERDSEPDSGALEVRGWIRFADGAAPSVLGLLAMVDAFPPTIIGSIDVGWVPTVELTVHVRGRPAPGWILGACRTRFLIDGVLEQDGELWDSTGRMVAMCRQLALVLPRR